MPVLSGTSRGPIGPCRGKTSQAGASPLRLFTTRRRQQSSLLPIRSRSLQRGASVTIRTIHCVAPVMPLMRQECHTLLLTGGRWPWRLSFAPARRHRHRIASSKPSRRREAVTLVEGNHAPEDVAKGIATILKPSANRGDSSARLYSGSFYERGIGVLVTRRRHFATSCWPADQGQVAAQYRLGDLYDLDEEAERNNEEGVRWIRRSAEGGSAVAQVDLGLKLLRAEAGHTRNSAEEWFELAAEHAGRRRRLQGDGSPARGGRQADVTGRPDRRKQARRCVESEEPEKVVKRVDQKRLIRAALVNTPLPHSA